MARQLVAACRPSPEVDRPDPARGYEAIVRQVEDFFDATLHENGRTVHPRVFVRLRELVGRELAALRPVLEDRIRRGAIRIVRDEEGRCRPAAPSAVVAAVATGLNAGGRADLAAAFVDEYLRASGDPEARTLVRFFAGWYGVAGVLRVPGGNQSAKAAWLLAFGQLEEPRRRPCLALVECDEEHGPPRIVLGLEPEAGLRAVRYARIRRRLGGGDAYRTPEWIDRVYHACLREAEQLLFEGMRVLVAAPLEDAEWRDRFAGLGPRWAVPVVALGPAGSAEPEVGPALERLRAAGLGD
jgi:hypothetical protein